MKRALAALLTLLLAILVAAPAHAQETGSLRIEKAGEGAQFQINQLMGIDVTTNAGWSELSGLTAASVIDGAVDLMPSQSAATINGVADFGTLPLGAYLVRELPTRTGDTAVSMSAPFLVTIPQNTPDGLLFDVVVKTKSQPIALLKSADATPVTRGQKFNYTLEGTVPAPDTGGRLYQYAIEDEYPAEVEFINEHSVTLHSAAGDELLVEGTDYLFTETGRTLRVEFTPVGLEILADARLSQEDLVVRFSFKVQVNNNVRPKDRLVNIGYLTTDGGLRVPSNKVDIPVRSEGGMPPTIPNFPGPDKPGSDKPDRPGGGSSETPPGKNPDDPAPGEGETGTATKEQGLGGLASTGANVVTVTIVGVVLVLIGMFLIRRKTDSRSK